MVCTPLDQCHDAGVCDPGTGACSNPVKANGTSCDDGSACTTSDACSGGSCVGSVTMDCDDGNSCTDDTCDTVTGCAHANNTAPCSDGNACTTNDTCASGACLGGPAPICDDGNVCTDDSCNTSAGCIYTNNAASCSDGNACTATDTCSGGACAGTPYSCDDANSCTSDACNGDGTCTHDPVPCSFTPGNLVIYRVGTGTGSLVNTGNPVFLDEYTPAGTLVRSVPMPTADTLPNRAFYASGTASSEGMISRSADGRYLVLTGYASTYTSSLSGTAGSVVNRVIGRVDASAAIDTTTALTDFASANNPRSATSDDGTRFWAAGGAGGVRYVAALGASTSTDLTTTAPTGGLANARQVAIVAGQLYVSSDRGTNLYKGVNAIGTGLPTTTSQPVVRLPGLTDATSASSFSYFFADLTEIRPWLRHALHRRRYEHRRRAGCRSTRSSAGRGSPTARSRVRGTPTAGSSGRPTGPP